MSLTEQGVRVPIAGAEVEPERRHLWMLDAACQGVDPELFFPRRGDSTAAAKEVCRGCPVRLDCLEYGIDEHVGIFGGLSERERRRLRLQRRRGAT